MSALRGAYLAGARAARRAATSTGLLGAMSASRSPTIRHLRSLFAIHDVADLAALDLAWWSYPAIRRVAAFLAERRRPAGPRVFEFGAGASTLWLARRAATVHSVEHDAGFAEHVTRLLDHPPAASPTPTTSTATTTPMTGEITASVTVHSVAPRPADEVRGGAGAVRSGRRGYEHLDFAEYVATIDRVGGPFDLIVVDGRARVAAFHRATAHLAEDGLIVFDNVTRARYRPALRRDGWRYELLRGATPALPYPTTTGLIRRHRT